MVRSILLLTVVFFLSSCDHLESQTNKQKTPPATQTGGGGQLPTCGEEQAIVPLAGYSVVSASQPIVSGSGVKGTADLIFDTELPEPDSNYKLSFRLAPNSALTLVAAADPNLANGVSMRFWRETDKVLHVQLRRSNSEDFDISSDFTSIDVECPINLSIDIHEHGHGLVWIGKQQLPDYAFAKLVYKRWGLLLQNAEVTKAVRGKAESAG